MGILIAREILYSNQITFSNQNVSVGTTLTELNLCSVNICSTFIYKIFFSLIKWGVAKNAQQWCSHCENTNWQSFVHRFNFNAMWKNCETKLMICYLYWLMNVFNTSWLCRKGCNFPLVVLWYWSFVLPLFSPFLFKS